MARPDAQRTRMTRQDVADLVKGEIVSGTYAPGDRLPSREQLAARISAGYVTIQHGIGILEAEGFVISRHGHGTFVTEHPPHLNHYAMLLIGDREVSQFTQNRYHQSLRQEVERFNANADGQHISIHQDMSDEVERSGYRQILSLAEERRVAGVIFPDLPIGLLASALFSLPGIGLATAAVPSHHAPGLVHIVPNREAVIERAVQRMAERGCRRLAVLTTRTSWNASRIPMPTLVGQIAARYGMTSPQHWTIPLPAEMAVSVRCVVRLLFQGDPADRPDALLVEDDHMIEAAAQGLQDAGIDTPVTIVGYCNFPDRPPSVLPYLPLGLDCRELLQAMIASIDAQVHGRPVIQVSDIEPIFGDEYEARYAD